MHNIFIIPILIALLSICDCFYKIKSFPCNAGKIRRDIKEKQEAQSRLYESKFNFGNLLKNGPISESKPSIYSKQIGQSVYHPRPSSLIKVHSGIRKVLQDYFDKIGRRSALDRLQLAWRPDEISRLNILSNPALEGKFKDTNTEINRPYEDETIKSKEWGKINVSVKPIHLLNPSKFDQVNSVLAQSLFDKPTITSKVINAPLVNLGNTKNVDQISERSRNLELILNKNNSEISPLVKSDILARTSFLTIIGNKTGVINPFQQINLGDKSKDLTVNKAAGGLLITHDNIFHDKSNDESRNDGYKNRIQLNDEQSIKSARRLFDVIQSQNPLDLLNIPVLMNSFTLDSHNHNNKINSKIINQPGSGVFERNDVTKSNSLIDKTTEKLAFPNNYHNDEKSRISFLSNLGNETFEKSYVPWDPISSVLTQGIGNLTLVLIPFNRLRFDSLVQNPGTNLNEMNKNRSDVKIFPPFSEEMRKINQIQDIFSKHFNDLNLKDFIELRPPKFGNTKEETVNLFSTRLKKPDEITFQKRVEDFFKVAKFNSSEMNGFNSRTLKSKSENVDARTKDLINIFNSSHFVLDPKQSNYHDQRQNLLPLLKVTANMAITKYCNNPMLENKKTPEFQTNSSSLPYNKTNLSKNSTLSQNLDISQVNKQMEMNSTPVETSTVNQYELVTETKSFKHNENNASVISSSMDSTNDGQGLRDTDSLNVTSDSLTSAVNPLQQSLKTSKFFPQNNKHNEDSENSNYFLGIETGIIIHSTTESSRLQTATDNDVSDGDDTYISKVLSKQNLTEDPLAEHYEIPLKIGRTENNATLTTGILNTEENISNTLLTNETNLVGKFEGEKSLNHSFKDNYMKMNTLELNNILSAMLIDESRDQGKWSKSLSSESQDNTVNQTASSIQDNGYPEYCLNTEQSCTSETEANLTKVEPLSRDILPQNEIPSSLSNIITKPVANFNSTDSRLSRLNPSLKSNITSTLNILKMPLMKPDKSASSISNKKENELWGNNHLSNDIAHYYMSNRTHHNVEETIGKDTKCEGSCQIPAVLIEILNRMESIVNGSAGYNMLIVPSQLDNSRESTEQPPTGLSLEEPLVSDTNKKQILQLTSVEPKILMTEASVHQATDGLYKVLTTELPESGKPDNFYQIMTMNNDSVINHLVSDDLKSLIPIPTTLNNAEIDDTTDAYNLTNQDMYLLQNYSNIQETRPLILVAFDPWKSWDNLSTFQIWQPNEPLGVFIKSSKPNKLDIPATISKSSIVKIGEPEQFCAPPSVALKCTTACPPENKYKQVTVYPIYPMYPVYPLKPIIVSNMTSNLQSNKGS